MGHSSLMVANAVPWGLVSGPAGLAPEALQERECSCMVFFASFTSVRSICFNRHRRCSSRLRSHAHDWYFSRSVHPKRCSRASSSRAWARSRRSGRALRLVLTRPRRPSAGRRVSFPQPPSIRSWIADSSLSCYRVVQVDAHAPFDKGWLVVRGLVHKSACAGLLGGARSRSLGTEGAEALRRWDPPRLAALTGSRTRHVGRPRAGGLEDRLECARPHRP
jgi:hypothetical protein